MGGHGLREEAVEHEDAPRQPIKWEATKAFTESDSLSRLDSGNPLLVQFLEAVAECVAGFHGVEYAAFLERSVPREPEVLPESASGHAEFFWPQVEALVRVHVVAKSPLVPWCRGSLAGCLRACQRP